MKLLIGDIIMEEETVADGEGSPCQLNCRGVVLPWEAKTVRRMRLWNADLLSWWLAWVVVMGMGMDAGGKAGGVLENEKRGNGVEKMVCAERGDSSTRSSHARFPLPALRLYCTGAASASEVDGRCASQN